MAVTVAFALAGEAADDLGRRFRRYLAAGFAAVLALATHTTMAGLLLGLGIWSVGRGSPGWLAGRRGGSWHWRRATAPRRPRGWPPGRCSWSCSSTPTPPGSYLSSLTEAASRVQSAEPDVERYIQPWWNDLPVLLADRTLVILARGSAALAAAATLLGVGARDPEAPARSAAGRHRATATPMLLTSVLVVCFLGLLMAIQWKFDRVLVGGVPLIAAWVGTSSGWAFHRVRSRRVLRVLAAVSLLLALGCATWTGSRLRGALGKPSHRRNGISRRPSTTS